MSWILIPYFVGCSWFAGPSGPTRLAMEEVPAKLASHTDEVIEVSGRYVAVSSGDEWIRLILRGEDEEADTLNCYTNRNGPKFKGTKVGTQLVVSGKVAEYRGELALLECDRVE